MAEDGFLPHQLARRGDRLVFSNGIVILGGLAIALIWAFEASTTRLIQLYIIGVFVSFTLSQTGMVQHWRRLLRGRERQLAARRGIRRSLVLNALGAGTTALVLIIVLIGKFTSGAWIVVIAMPLVFGVMLGIRRHYDHVAAELLPPARGVALPSRIHAIVLVSKLHTPTLRALAFARATHPSSLVALTVRTSAAETDTLVEQWTRMGIPIPLTVVDSSYRDLTGPVLAFICDLRAESPRDVVCVFIPEYVVGHWWEQLLHNQSALRLKVRLLFQPGVMVTNVPWQLGSAQALESRMDGSDASPQATRSGTSV